MEEQLLKDRRNLMRSASILFLVLSALAVAVFFLVANAIGVIDNEYPQNTITVTGKGEVLAVPDVAEISFSVMEEAETAEEAQRMAVEKISEIIEFLDDSGVEEEDVKTTSYNLNPQYEYFYENSTGQICSTNYCPPPYYRTKKINGYEFNQWVQVKIREIDEAGEILAGITEFGASNVSGLNLVVDDEEELKTEARELAIKDARDEAKRLAKELGVRLGDIVSFNEYGNYPIFYDGYGRGGAYMEDAAVSVSSLELKAPSPEIPVGENEIISNVTIIYEIK